MHIIVYTGPGGTPEGGWLVSWIRYRLCQFVYCPTDSGFEIQNLSPGVLKPSTLPVGHEGFPQY